MSVNFCRKIMKNFICSMFLILVMILAAAAIPRNHVHADSINTSRTGSVTVEYDLDGVQFSLYKVADIVSSGRFTLSGSFSGYPVDVNSNRTTTAWGKLAVTLQSYVTADSVKALKSGKTSGGTLKFSGLETGLYLLSGSRYEPTKGDIYTSQPALISVPTEEDSGNLAYHLIIRPKMTEIHPSSKTIQKKVVKHWYNDGDGSSRAASVRVSIYKDGAKYQTVTLSEENNWTFEWSCSDDGSAWTVKELTTVDNYSVIVSGGDDEIILTNSYNSDSPNNPTTSDDDKSKKKKSSSTTTITPSSGSPDSSPPSSGTSSSGTSNSGTSGTGTSASTRTVSHTPGTGSQARTGDDTSMMWLVMGLAAAGLLLIVTGLSKKSQGDEE